MTHANPKILIGGLQKSSLIDYPGKISAIVFTQGCNFRCPYCHNPELIKGNREQETVNWKLNVSSVIEFLSSRIGKLDGVVISGGEPTLHSDLPEFIKEIKDLGFLVKLDTNGTNPMMLSKLLDSNLIDYVAMDIKAPIEKYESTVCASVDTENILKSIELLKFKSGIHSIGYEFRTTVINSQLSVQDFEKIGKLIEGAEKYYLQKFVPVKTLDKDFLTRETYTDEEFEAIAESLKKYVKKVYVR